jgi:hypothetical protein
MSTCWYTGVELKKATENLKQGSSNWDIETREHVINRTSPLFSLIVRTKSGSNMTRNVRRASAYVNSSISNFILPMKVMFREIFKETYGDVLFKHEHMFVAAVKNVIDIVRDTFKLGRTNDMKLLSARYDILLWEREVALQKFPEIRLHDCPTPVSENDIAYIRVGDERFFTFRGLTSCIE